MVGVLAPLIRVGDNVLCNVGVDWLVPTASLLRTPSVILISVGIDLRLVAKLIILLHSPLIVLRLRLIAPLIILLICAPLVAWWLLLVSPRVGLYVSLSELIVVGLSASSADLEQNLACSLALVVQLNDL